MFQFVMLAFLSFSFFEFLSDKAPDWPEIRASIARDFPDVAQVSTKELHKMFESQGVAPLILDARSEIEFAVSHIHGAQLVSSKSQLRQVLKGVALDRDIVVYCSVGIRSSKLVGPIESLGFSHVRNLDGSIFAWANEGRPLVAGGVSELDVQEANVTTDQVHPFNKRWGRLLRRDLWSWGSRP